MLLSTLRNTTKTLLLEIPVLSGHEDRIGGHVGMVIITNRQQMMDSIGTFLYRMWVWSKQLVGVA